MNATNEKPIVHPVSGKQWRELSWQERSEWLREDEETARLAKDQCSSRPWVGRDFGSLNFMEKHLLATTRPHLYERLKREHEAAKEG